MAKAKSRNQQSNNSALGIEATIPNEAGINGKSDGADGLHNATLDRQAALRNHRCQTRDLLLPRLQSGKVEFSAELRTN